LSSLLKTGKKVNGPRCLRSAQNGQRAPLTSNAEYSTLGLIQN
jgi:hypothetical protein